jgi:hypothetical protein
MTNKLLNLLLAAMGAMLGGTATAQVQLLLDQPSEDNTYVVMLYAPDERSGLHIAYFDNGQWNAMGQLCASDYGTWGAEKKMYAPSVARTDDGTWVLYVIDARYTSRSLDGPWEKGKFEFDPQGKPIIEGLSNLSFARRPEGGWLMVCRGGGIWTSDDGLSTWRQISDGSVYPKVDGRFEDPVLWRDSVQYNLIVNDWLGRIAYYLRSADGRHWQVDDGEAYMPGIARHADGSREEWFKYERMRILQDEHGRAVQANFAVIDTIKWDDKPLDRHSSKNICIPLDPGLLLAIPATTKANAGKLTLRIRAEEGFEPQRDLDLSSLRCGSPHEVDYGRGAAPTSSRVEGRDLVLTFRMRDLKFTPDDFAAKVIVTRRDGSVTFGFARLPWF